MILFQESINLRCNIKMITFPLTKTMEMNKNKTKNFQQMCLTATWGDMLSDAADLHPVTGCLRGLTISGSAGHYRACHIKQTNKQNQQTCTKQTEN